MAKHFKMLNSKQQNNGTKVSHKYVHTRNITPFYPKKFLEILLGGLQELHYKIKRL